MASYWYVYECVGEMHYSMMYRRAFITWLITDMNRKLAGPHTCALNPCLHAQPNPIIPWPRRIKPRTSHLWTYKNLDTAIAYDNLHIPLPNQTELRSWPKTQSLYTLTIPSLDHDQKPLNRHKFPDIFCISCRRFQHNANTRDLAGLYTYSCTLNKPNLDHDQKPPNRHVKSNEEIPFTNLGKFCLGANTYDIAWQDLI